MYLLCGGSGKIKWVTDIKLLPGRPWHAASVGCLLHKLTLIEHLLCTLLSTYLLSVIYGNIFHSFVNSSSNLMGWVSLMNSTLQNSAPRGVSNELPVAEGSEPSRPDPEATAGLHWWGQFTQLSLLTFQGVASWPRLWGHFHFLSSTDFLCSTSLTVPDLFVFAMGRLQFCDWEEAVMILDARMLYVMWEELNTKFQVQLDPNDVENQTGKAQGGLTVHHIHMVCH